MSRTDEQHLKAWHEHKAPRCHPPACAQANRAGYYSLTDTTGAMAVVLEGRVAGERWHSLPDHSSHLPRGRQRMWERPAGREEVLLRPQRLIMPPLIRHGWWTSPTWWSKNRLPEYQWTLVRWRRRASPADAWVVLRALLTAAARWADR